MTTDVKLTYQQLQEFIQNYFNAVAKKDLVTLMSLYAEDASFAVHTADNGGDPIAWGKLIVFKNKQEIHKLYEQFFLDIKRITICHAEYTVIDEKQQSIATEQRFVAYNNADEVISLYNCNLFSFNTQGQICRVMNWSANEPY